MSNGSLAELPPDNLPDSIMLLLPHNKYLLGTSSDRWIYGRPGTVPQNVYLYDNEGLSLMNDGAQPTILPAQTVNDLRRKLFMHADPPGRHASTVLMLRTMMHNHPVFCSDSAEFLDEKIFSQFMENDETLRKAYWTLRFALSRGEGEVQKRLKAWLKAGPEVFADPKYCSKVWLSLQDLPDKSALDELAELSFSKSEMKRLSAQMISPMVLYNPVSGWLILGRFGRGAEIIFSCWIFINHELWQELRERRKLSIDTIIHAVWGEQDTRQAINERAKYK